VNRVRYLPAVGGFYISFESEPGRIVEFGYALEKVNWLIQETQECQIGRTALSWEADLQNTFSLVGSYVCNLPFWSRKCE